MSQVADSPRRRSLVWSSSKLPAKADPEHAHADVKIRGSDALLTAFLGAGRPS